MVTRVVSPGRIALFTRHRGLEPALSLRANRPHTIASSGSIGPNAHSGASLHQRQALNPPRTHIRFLTGSSTALAADPPRPARIPRAVASPHSSPAKDPPEQFRRRRVVSSFICHGTPHTSTFRVSAFKRSTQVRTYPGRWAACSGSVEADDTSPVRAALRELREETGLLETDVVRIGGGGGPLDASGEEGFGEGGIKFELRDDYLKVLWEVWPFLWKVVEEDGTTEAALEDIRRRIQLDWEHDEMKFVGLEQLRGMKTVTDLGRGVRVVLASLERDNMRALG